MLRIAGNVKEELVDNVDFADFYIHLEAKETYHLHERSKKEMKEFSSTDPLEIWFYKHYIEDIDIGENISQEDALTEIKEYKNKEVNSKLRYENFVEHYINNIFNPNRKRIKE